MGVRPNEVGRLGRPRQHLATDDLSAAEQRDGTDEIEDQQDRSDDQARMTSQERTERP
jgi:hypothetical protein